MTRNKVTIGPYFNDLSALSEEHVTFAFKVCPSTLLLVQQLCVQFDRYLARVKIFVYLKYDSFLRHDIRLSSWVISGGDEDY